MFGEQAALANHQTGGFAVTGRIEVVEPVGKHANGFISLLKRVAMGADVNAIGQSTHDEHLRTELFQFLDEASHQVLSVNRDMASAHNIDNALLVKVGRSFIEKQQRGIVAFAQTAGIETIVQRKNLYAMLLAVVVFLLGPRHHHRNIPERFQQSRRGIGDDVAHIGVVLHDDRGRPHRIVEQAQSGQLDMAYVDPEYSEVEIPGMHMVELSSVDNYGFNMPMVPSGGETTDGNPVGNDVTSDFAVRKALNIGIDRETIIRNALNGHGVPAYARVTGLPWCIENPEFEDNQKEEACRILEDAGWIDTDGDGIREKDGVKAEFSLMCFSNAADRYKLAVALSEDAKELGIQVNAESQSRDVTSAMRLAQPLMGASGSYTPAELTRYKSGASGNLSSYSNPVVDDYIDQALAAKTYQDANEFWHKMQSDGVTGINEDITDIWIIRMPANFYIADGLDIGDSFCFASHHGMPLSDVEMWTYAS